MDDQYKTKDELIRELEQLRSQLDRTDQPPHAVSPDFDQLNALTQAAESLLGVHDLDTLRPGAATRSRP